METNFITLIKETFHFSDIEKELSLLQIGEHLYDIKLTDVEVKLFREGLQDGIVDSENHQIARDNIIRCEILEWLVTLPDAYSYLFRKNKLHIRNANILSMEQYLTYENNGYAEKTISNTNIYVLNIPNKEIKIDLSFGNCVFWGGINMSRATLKNLEFLSCKLGQGTVERDFFTNFEIHSSIYAEQAKIMGNLVFDGQENDSILKEVGGTDCGGDLTFTNCIIENHVKIRHFLTKYAIDFSFSTFEQINIWRLGVFESSLRLLYCAAKNIYIHGSFFLAPNSKGQENKSIAIDCTGLFSEYLYIRHYNVIIGTTLLENMDIKEVVNLKSSLFISPKKSKLFYPAKQSENEELDIPPDEFDTSINLRNSNVKILFLSDFLTSIGTLNCQNIKAKSIDLSRSRFLNYEKENEKEILGKSIVLRDAHVDNTIAFNTRNTTRIGWYVNPTTKKDIVTYQGTYEILKDSFSSKFDTKNDSIETIFKRVFNDSGLLDKIIEIEGNEDQSTGSLYKTYAEKNCLRQGESKKQKIPSSEITLSKRALVTSFHKRYSLIVGEADLSGAFINSKLDCAGGFFYGKKANGKDSRRNNNALNLKYLKLNGDLFLNDPNSSLIPSFKALGRVDLHSARISQFFITPKCGTDEDTEWRVIGLKYEYIYNNGGKEGKKQLESCDWFQDYKKEENFRQPYEQLAKAFYRAGDDTRAKRVLIRERTKVGRNIFEKYLFHFFNLFICPAWVSFLGLVVVWLGSSWVFEYLYANNGFIKTESPASRYTAFSSLAFSFKNMIPISFIDNIFLPTSTLSTNHFVTFHKVLSTLLLASFIIGIARITKKESE